MHIIKGKEKKGFFCCVLVSGLVSLHHRCTTVLLLCVPFLNSWQRHQTGNVTSHERRVHLLKDTPTAQPASMIVIVALMRRALAFAAVDT